MRVQLEQLRTDARARIAGARDAASLDALEVEILGRKQGKLTAILHGLTALRPDERKSVGALANTVKEEIAAAFADARARLTRNRMANLADAEWVDVTAPGTRVPAGSLHPVAEAIHDIASIFERIGFIRARHPEVDSEFYAFSALNMPADHPARDEWETFFVRHESTRAREHESSELLGPNALMPSSRIVLTPHTSNGQVREMEKGVLPIRMVNIGKCYRRQIDATHTPMFHQFEGLLVDRDVAVTHLKGTLDYFVRAYFGPDRRTRLRPYHFQFTEPSFEIDISCAVCGGTGRRGGFHTLPRADVKSAPTADVGERCKTCKSGWLELGGAGMVHPSVLRAGGIDPDEYSGFAFGWGVERVLMMKTGISDIRLLYGNDLRALFQ